MKKPTLTCYTSILEDLDILKDSGLLTDERINEIKTWIAPESFTDVKLEGGGVVAGYRLHVFTKKMWQSAVLERGWNYIVTTDILNELLTEEEIIKINVLADGIWSNKKEKERFAAAKKIDAADYNGWVICGDDYYPSVSEYLDYIESENYDLGEEDEKVLPEEYVWACAGTPCCQINLDHIIENATDEAYEDYNGPIGVKELQKAVDKFNKLNEDDLSYTPDYKKAIIL